MGKGIEAADAGIHGEVLNDFKDQLLIVLLKELRRLGHSLEFPLAQVDDTGGDVVSFSIDDNNVFHFTLGRKS